MWVTNVTTNIEATRQIDLRKDREKENEKDGKKHDEEIAYAAEYKTLCHSKKAKYIYISLAFLTEKKIYLYI